MATVSYFTLWIIFGLCAGSTVPSTTDATTNCTNHSDCNRYLRQLLDQLGDDELPVEQQSNDQNHKPNSSLLLKTLSSLPRAFCRQSKCVCESDRLAYHPVDKICRIQCNRLEDCAWGEEGDEVVVVSSSTTIIAMICGEDHFCRCPAGHTEHFNANRCYPNASLALLDIVLIVFVGIIIFLVPIILMIVKHRNYRKLQTNEPPPTEL